MAGKGGNKSSGAGQPPTQGTNVGKSTNNGGFGKSSDSKGGSKSGGSRSKGC